MKNKMTNNIKITWPTPGNIITSYHRVQYTIGQPIDQGGFALIFEAIDSFENPVVLKIFKPANRPFNKVKSQWEKESKIFEKMRHPNVVAIYDAFICENLFYIVLERAWGNLCNWINVKKPIQEGIVREIARQLLFAIHFIHTHGVVHRDITIYNTLVFHGPKTKGAIFKISGFGISKEFADPWEEKICHTNIAHPCFIPPELISKEYGYTNPRTDLYHLGLILLYALKGNLFFNKSMSQEEIRKQIIDGVPRQTAEKIRTPLGKFISILLRRRSEYRFSSPLEAWDKLKTKYV